MQRILSSFSSFQEKFVNPDSTDIANQEMLSRYLMDEPRWVNMYTQKMNQNIFLFLFGVFFHYYWICFSSSRSSSDFGPKDPSSLVQYTSPYYK